MKNRGLCSHRHSHVGGLSALHQFEDGLQRLFFTLTFEPLRGQLLQSSAKLLVRDDPRRLLSSHRDTKTIKLEQLWTRFTTNLLDHKVSPGSFIRHG